MEADGSFQNMLASLRQNLGARIPGGLSQPADQRLQRTLRHYIGQVLQVKGALDEQDILRETFESMVAWYKRNREQLAPTAPPTVASGPAAPSQPGLPPPEIPMDGEEDPLVLFERIKAQRAAAAAAAAPAPQEPAPAPIRHAELMPLPPQLEPTPGPVQQKDIVQKMEDVVKYRETEYNVILNSKDRDWLHSSEENRYNFSVVLNGGTRPQGTGLQATLQNRFRNIVRIEFIKAMLPVEALDVIVPLDCSASPTAVPAVEEAFYSALSLPYVSVVMDEQQGNNYGTNDVIDKSLAIIQYDATWRSDSHTRLTRNVNRGYTLFFPKHMKAQRVYAPTPLANLQKMSFQLLGPENLPLSKLPDAVQIAQIFDGVDASGSCYNVAQSGVGEYIFIRTKEWFPIWSFSMTDRIKLAGLSYKLPTNISATATLQRWLQREEGHAVIGVANTNQTSAPLTIDADGNACGYANLIIIRNRFKAQDASGDCSLDWFTGTSTGDSTFWDDIAAFPAEYQEGGALNLSRQVQLVLRVVTRDMDAATNTRPDNI
jgi:hypothetical protein